MKTAAAMLITILFTARLAAAGSLSIDAHEIASGATYADAWTTSWGSYDRKTVGLKTLEVVVRNLGRAKATANVTVYFISNGEEVGNASHDFKLDGEIEKKSRVTAPETLMRTLKLNAIKYESREGLAPITNWFAIGRLDGKIFGFKASNEPTRLELEKRIREGTLK